MVATPAPLVSQNTAGDYSKDLVGATERVSLTVAPGAEAARLR
jgi:hypothetical protein